jgi:hypothetical protein
VWQSPRDPLPIRYDTWIETHISGTTIKPRADRRFASTSNISANRIDRSWPPQDVPHT